MRALVRILSCLDMNLTAAILLFILRGLRTLFQRFAVPDPALAGVAGEFEILGEFEGVDGAGVFAEAAEHAAAKIVGEVGELLAAGVLVAGAGDDDEIFRAGHGAQVAGNAHGLVGIGVDVEARGAAITLGDLRTLQRILLGIDLLGILIKEGDLQTLKEIDEEDFAQQARHAHDGVRISGFKVSRFQGFKDTAFPRLSAKALKLCDFETLLLPYLTASE